MADTETPVARRPSLLRRCRVPIIAFALPVLLWVLVPIRGRFELVPEAAMWLVMAAMFATELAILVVLVWFFFFSGYRWRTRGIGLLVLLVVVGTVYAGPRRWEFGAGMTPVPIFRWDPDLQDELEKRLAKQGDEKTTLSSADLLIQADDFPRYRGVRADGIVSSPMKSPDWDAAPPKEKWRTTVGWSYSGIAVAGKALVTIEQRQDEEAVVCYDRETGKELWAYKYEAKFEQTPPMGGIGPRATPTICDGEIYSLGAKGHLVCLDAAGAKKWAVNIVEDNGAEVVQWGMTSSPLIVGDLVVVNAGIDPKNNQKKAVVAYHRKDGTKAWAAGEHPAGYSSPMLATLDGVEQIVLFDGVGVAGIDKADGRELWRYAWNTFNAMNIIQPVILPGDRVFISSQVENGCALLQVKKNGSNWSVDKVWSTPKMASIFSNPVYHEGHIYGLHDMSGRLCCLDAKSGKRLWLADDELRGGQLLLSGNTLIVQSENTKELIAVAADPTEYHELGRVKVFRGRRTWNTPSLAGGRLYVRNHEEMVCLELAK